MCLFLCVAYIQPRISLDFPSMTRQNVGPFTGAEDAISALMRCCRYSLLLKNRETVNGMDIAMHRPTADATRRLSNGVKNLHKDLN